MKPDSEKTSAVVREVIALEAEHRSAFVARDMARLEALWSDALIVNSPVNRVHRKQQVLALLEAGTIAHSAFDAQIEAVERQQDLVIVMGSETVINAPGSPAFQRRFTNVWHMEDGRLRMIARHANVVAGP